MVCPDGYEWNGSRLTPSSKAETTYDPLAIPDLFLRFLGHLPRDRDVEQFTREFGLIRPSLRIEDWRNARDDLVEGVAGLLPDSVRLRRQKELDFDNFVAAVKGQRRGTLVEAVPITDRLATFSPQITWGEDALEIGLPTLEQYLWLQLWQTRAVGHHVQVCVECGTLFLVAPSANRPDRRYCSDRCRVRYFRRRKENALDMHTRGYPPSKIAERLGTDTKTIRNWIKEAQS